jgi:hypothetical protein
MGYISMQHYLLTIVLVTLHLLLCREDLVNALNKLYERREQIDHIIIETTGLANPGPIVSSFYMDRYGVAGVQISPFAMCGGCGWVCHSCGMAVHH